jgi:dTDP-4-dehydrorhamnose 3,5-epimerase
MKNNQIPKIIKSKIYKDKRGSLKEIFKSKDYNKKFKFFLLVSSKKNVFRGFHFQKRKQQEKLVVVVKGKIIDYCIDLRKKSKTFGKVFKFTLKEKSVLLVPKGFAHGYTGVSKESLIVYFLSEYRYRKFESGISLFDKNIKINLKKNKLILSEKDKKNYTISEFKKKIGSL